MTHHKGRGHATVYVEKQGLAQTVICLVEKMNMVKQRNFHLVFVFIFVNFLATCIGGPYKLRDCKITNSGEEYEGTVAETVSGLTCQRWDSQTPHTHGNTNAGYFPDASMEDVANYCRNPDAENDGPWCYTMDSGTRWEFCPVDKCPTDFPECKISDEGTEYRGSLSETASGQTCKAWEEIPLDKLWQFNSINFNDDANFCRNPDNKAEGPWCFVEGSDDEWEYCEVPFCKPSASCTNSADGKDYVGTVGWTSTGRTCQRWDKQAPHSHTNTDPDFFPDETLEDAGNFCRNPDDEPTAWCYTTDSDIRFELCDVPLCQDCKTSEEGRDYAGTLSTTASGRTCQRWDSQTPHPHTMTDIDRFPDMSLEAAGNMCRNPDNKNSGPWCYTEDPDEEWEQCDIPFCNEDGNATPRTRVHHVLHIGIDGLKPTCIADAPGGAPNMLDRLRSEGTSTLTTGRAVLQTVSAPNWSATVCGMPIESTGITGNSWCPPWMSCNEDITPITGNNVPLPCVFQTAKNQDVNIQTAAFYDWSWIKYVASRGMPGSLDKDYFCAVGSWAECDANVASNATEYFPQILQSAERSYTFVYFGDVDETGHAHTWCGTEYLEAVQRSDDYVGQLLDLIDEADKYDDVLVMVSTDHGGLDFGHGRWADSDIIIPMFLRGPTVKAGYEFDHEVRNMDMAQTGLFALGLKPSPWMKGQIMKEAFEDL